MLYVSILAIVVGSVVILFGVDLMSLK